jgi:hypothetical protein
MGRFSTPDGVSRISPGIKAVLSLAALSNAPSVGPSDHSTASAGG